MPLLIEAIRAEYPQLIRATALACIDTMSYEAELAAPHVEQLLTDES